MLFHMLAVACWSIPGPPTDVVQGRAEPVGTDHFLIWNRTHITPNLEWYIQPLGFWQFWGMFAPNPADADIWVDAILIYPDGSQRIAPYPRIREMGLVRKYWHEGFRKYLEYVTPDPTNPYEAEVAELRRSSLGFWLAARAVREDPSQIPSQVILRRHFRLIPPPGEPVPRDYITYEFYRTYLDQRALRAIAEAQ